MSALDEQLMTALRAVVRDVVRAELACKRAGDDAAADDDRELRELAAHDAAALRRRRPRSR